MHWAEDAAWTPFHLHSQMAAVALTVSSKLSWFYNDILLNNQHNLTAGLDPDISPDEQEEKARLIAQVLELQNTLDGT